MVNIKPYSSYLSNRRRFLGGAASLATASLIEVPKVAIAKSVVRSSMEPEAPSAFDPNKVDRNLIQRVEQISTHHLSKITKGQVILSDLAENQALAHMLVEHFDSAGFESLAEKVLVQAKGREAEAVQATVDHLAKRGVTIDSDWSARVLATANLNTSSYRDMIRPAIALYKFVLDAGAAEGWTPAELNHPQRKLHILQVEEMAPSGKHQAVCQQDLQTMTNEYWSAGYYTPQMAGNAIQHCGAQAVADAGQYIQGFGGTIYHFASGHRWVGSRGSCTANDEGQKKTNPKLLALAADYRICDRLGVSCQAPDLLVRLGLVRGGWGSLSTDSLLEYRQELSRARSKGRKIRPHQRSSVSFSSAHNHTCIEPYKKSRPGSLLRTSGPFSFAGGNLHSKWYIARGQTTH